MHPLGSGVLPRLPQSPNKQTQKLSSHPASQDGSKIRYELKDVDDVSATLVH